MRKLFKKAGFHKTDEMEHHIAMTASMFSWLYACFFLVAWFIMEQITGTKQSCTLLLLSSMMIVYFSVMLWMMHHLTIDERGQSPIIRPLRKAMGLRQEDLANMLNVTRQTIIAMENNRYDPSLELAMRVALLLQRPVEEIFLLQDDDPDK